MQELNGNFLKHYQNLPAVRDSGEKRIGDELTPVERTVLNAVRSKLADKSVDERTTELKRRYIEQCANTSGVRLQKLEEERLLAHLDKEDRLFGILQDYVDDPQISDIIVHNESKIVVKIGRDTVKTDLKFPSAEDYESFIERLLQKAGATYSVKQPIVDAMIGDYARLHVVHKELCNSGPYLTIRINRFSCVTAEDLINSGSAPREVFEYLSMTCKAGMTIFIAGEVSTGKTTLLRAIAREIPHSDSILCIEDTPEIQLDHPDTRYLETRVANIEGEGRVSPADCIKASMRMAMNRIIFGEIRDPEASESFVDVCASGHPGLSTIHSRTAKEAIERLKMLLGRAQRSVSKDILTTQIAQSVQVIVHLRRCPVTRKRRISEVVEITGAGDGVIRLRNMFSYKVVDGQPVWEVVTAQSAFEDELKSQGYTPPLVKHGQHITFGQEQKATGFFN